MPKKIQLDIPLLSKLLFRHKGNDISCLSLSNLQIALLKDTFYVVLKTNINLDVFPNENMQRNMSKIHGCEIQDISMRISIGFNFE